MVSGPAGRTLIKSMCLSASSGAIAQLGERIVRNDEVVGSIPTSSTKAIRFHGLACDDGLVGIVS
jgi:hypothetical protein